MRRSNNQNRHPATRPSPGTSAVTFGIALHKPGSQFPGRFASRRGLHPRADFINTYANGDIYGYLNSQLVMTLDLSLIDWTDATAPTIPAGDLTGTATASDGSTISWASSLTGTTLSVTATLNTIAGKSYKFGVVQTNGPCVGPDPCLATNDGYVMAEGQTPSFTTPKPPANNDLTLTLGGVLEAGYLCNLEDTTDCSTFPGPLDADGTYHYAAFPTDENGNPVVGYSEPLGGWPAQSSEAPYDNGGWSIVVLSGSDVVQVDSMALSAADGGTDPFPNGTSLGPFTVANPHQMGSGNWWDAEGFTVKCVKTGTAVVAMQMVPASKSAGSVGGFAYNSPSNYPAAGALLGSTGADTYYGNGEGVTFACSGQTIIVIN